ncbi:ATP-binding protein [Streptomyces sp. NPDC056987]|uniref:ATP-binding protein n=1 Tax=Streptomyces sp. NPDC056987 TaxID=3345988 RepID=UPI00362BE5FF
MTSASVLSHVTARHTSVDLARCARSCGHARQWAHSALTDWAYSAVPRSDVLMVVSELVANALIHACGPIRAHLDHRADGSLQVAVDDGGPSLTTSAPDPEEHGRGLVLVAALADEFGRSADVSSPYTARHWATLSAA